MDTSADKPSSFSDSGSGESSFGRSSGCQRNADPGNTLARQKEHNIQSTDFDTVVVSKLSVNSLVSLPLGTVPSALTALSSFFSTQTNNTGIGTASRTAYLFSSSSTCLQGVAITSVAKKAHDFSLRSEAETFFSEMMQIVTLCTIVRNSSR